MTIKNTNISPAKVSYLDLLISIHRGKYIFKSYDKRDDFGFDIINFPNLASNIPQKHSYGVYLSQLDRICKINYNHHFFKRDLIKLISKFISQNFSKDVLKQKYYQFCRNKKLNWVKFGIDITSDKFIANMFS